MFLKVFFTTIMGFGMIGMIADYDCKIARQHPQVFLWVVFVSAAIATMWAF
jgi:hypothetical protein